MLFRAKPQFSVSTQVINTQRAAESIKSIIKSMNLFQAELQVDVSVTNPLVSADVYAVSNHMTIRVDSVYSLPETWQPSNNAVSLQFIKG